MNVAIVYDSRTGNTAAAAARIAEEYRSRGHRVSICRSSEAEAKTFAAADVVCVGSWTQGLFLILQHPTAATMKLIDRLPSLAGKEAVVFCSYALSPGNTLQRMAEALERKGARVSSRLAFKDRIPTEGFQRFTNAIASARIPS